MQPRLYHLYIITLRTPTPRSLNEQPSIDAHDLVVHISGLDHPHNGFGNLLGLAQPTDGDFYIPAISKPIPTEATCNGKHATIKGDMDLLAANSGAEGSILVSSINAGATPLTVMPFFPYAPANQCTRPCKADLDDLESALGQPRLDRLGFLGKESPAVRILKLTHNAARPRRP